MIVEYPSLDIYCALTYYGASGTVAMERCGGIVLVAAIPRTGTVQYHLSEALTHPHSHSSPEGSHNTFCVGH